MRNHINKGRFKMVFSGIDSRLVTTEIATIDLPSVDVSATEIPLNYGFVAKRTSGNVFNLGELTINFFLDEDLKIYEFFYDKILDNCKPENGEIRDTILQAELMLLTHEGKVVKNIEFVNLQVLSIPTLTLEVNNSDTSYEIFSVSFSCELMKLKKNRLSKE